MQSFWEVSAWKGGWEENAPMLRPKSSILAESFLSHFCFLWRFSFISRKLCAVTGGMHIMSSGKTWKLIIVAQDSAIARIKWLSHNSFCTKVKARLTTPSMEFSLCDRSSEVCFDPSWSVLREAGSEPWWQNERLSEKLCASWQGDVMWDSGTVFPHFFVRKPWCCWTPVLQWLIGAPVSI